MNRKALIITLSITAVSVIGIFLYDFFYNRPEETLWDLVPETASWVYEPQAGLEALSRFRESEIWETLRGFEEITKLDSVLVNLDTLVGTSDLNNALSDGNFLISAHPVSGSETGFMFYLGLGTRRSTNSLNVLLSKLQEGKKLSERNFNGYVVHEIKDRSGKVALSYSSTDFGWFGSSTPFLVEDVIRLLTTENIRNFKSANPETFFNARIRNDAGNIFFSYRNLAQWLTTFLDPKAREGTNSISTFSRNAFFDVDIIDQMILMNGFSYVSGQDNFLAGVSGTVPRKSYVEQYIPSRTAFCISSSLNLEGDSLSADLKAFSATLDNEYAVSVLEGSDVSSAEKLYYLRSNNVQKSVELLTDLSRRERESKGDSLYVETFMDYSITELPLKNFPSNFSHFSYGKSDYYFFVSVNQYIILSTSIESMKAFLTDLETENTWGKSVQKNRFIGSTLEETNFSLYVDVNKAWNFLLSELHPSWREHLEVNANLFRKFELISLQFSVTDNKVFSNVVVSHNGDRVDVFTQRRKLDPDYQALLNAKISLRPKIVRNHQTQDREILVQTDSLALHLISAQGKVLWTRRTSGKIPSDIQQIDFFKNGNLQYFFAVDSSVWLIDRNGQAVDGFPWKLPFSVDRFNVIDYDRSRNYRFILSDIRGNVFMYDKDGNALEGWRPFFSGGRLAMEPRHFRVRGKDMIVLFQQNGKFFLVNRRAEVYPGFPVDLGAEVGLDYYLNYGSDFGNSILHFLNRKGLLTTINLEGTVLGREQYVSNLRNPEYVLVPETQGKGFLVAAYEAGAVQFLGDRSKEVLAKTMGITNRPVFQYYEFGSGKRLYVVTDRDQEFSYLYNASGELVNNTPIDSKFDIGVLFSEGNNQYRIFSAYENKVNIYTF